MPVYTLTQNPSNIPNLTLWLDAADQSTLGLTQTGTFTASVSSIKNKVGTENLVANDQRPTYYYSGVNNKGSIYFNNLNPTTGGNLTLSHMTMSFSLTHSLYFVSVIGTTNSANSGRHILGIRKRSRGTLTGGYNDIQIAQAISGGYQLVGVLESSSSTYFTLNGNYRFGPTLGLSGSEYFQPSVLSTRAYGTFSAVKSEYYSSSTFSSSTFSNSIVQKFGGGGTYSMIILGDYINASYSIAGSTKPCNNSHFCEMLFYSRVLTDEENNRVTQYLKNKWLGQ